MAIDTPLHTKVIPSYIVLDCIEPSEYTALADAAKDGLRIILSCGQVDISGTSIVRARLNAIFPSGITRTKIDVL